MKSGLKLALTLSVGIATPALGVSPEEESFDKLIEASTRCLKQEVDSQIPPGQIEINDEQRTKIRMIAAKACHDYDRQLAGFTDVVLSGKKSVAEVSEQLLVNSLNIADANVSMRLKLNNENAD